jgi:uncharacterized protein
MTLTANDIKDYVRKFFAGTQASHDWDHSERVRRLCLHIGKAEGADLEILEIAAYLHDIGRPLQDKSKGAVCHAEKGAEMARALLEGYAISRERKENIIHSIRSHRFRGTSEPRSIEAKVLYDADKLDSIGAIGIARTFLFAGEVGAKLHNPGINPEETQPYTEEDTGFREFKVKLSKIKDRMLTAEGARLAMERHAFMEEFFHRFLLEYEGQK